MNHSDTGYEGELFDNLAEMRAEGTEIPHEDELASKGSIDDDFDLDVELADGRLA
ncbi:MAG: hypothetical protein H5U40_10905 [Polyangiaceae bacterium]|nr:hypothetical protein [Polyangiaceae bacterium]